MATEARLRAFVAVAELASVRLAAQRLVLTESAVSAAVAALAGEIGVPLVERHGRGVRITPAGKIYADYARIILGLQAEARAAARGEAQPHRGELRLAAVTTAAEHVLPALLAGFRERYPDVAIAVHVETRAELWPLLDEHQVDVVLGGRPPDGHGFRVRATRANELVVVTGPELAERFAPDAATWLMREPGSGTRATCEALFVSADIVPAQLTLGSNGAVVAGAVHGLGATLVSRDAVTAELAAGTLVEVRMRGVPLARPWHAVTNERITAPARLFVRYLRDDQAGWRGARSAGPRR